MKHRTWLFVVPVALAAGLGAHGFIIARASGNRDRIISKESLREEATKGIHIYAPCWLPYEGHVGHIGMRKGARRILQDYADSQDRIEMIMGQEPHDAKRDKYNQDVFVKHAETKARINDVTGYFVTGTGGERRLYWSMPDAVLILSSSVLSDDELLEIARKVR